MKIWFKIWENTHLLKSETIEDNTEDTRTHKIFHALEEVCLKWDLGKPIWFDANIAEFQRHARTRFGKDNFGSGWDGCSVKLQQKQKGWNGLYVELDRESNRTVSDPAWNDAGKCRTPVYWQTDG